MDSIPNPVANNSVEKDSRVKSSKLMSCRYSMSVMGCIGLAIAYAIRVNLSVALVAMVNSTESTMQDSKTIAASQKSKEFTWTEETQGVILSSFFYGYIVTQLPGGWMASKFGGKHVFGVGILLSVILTLLTPWAAEQSVAALVAVRVLEGVGQGVTFPAINVLLSSWSPPDERGMMLTVTYTGSSLGTIIAQTSAGALCASTFLGGWPSVFYITGFLGVVWYVSWLFLVYEKPALHPRISEYEKNYIISSLGASQDNLVKKHKVPWLAIAKSLPVHALNITYICSGWAFFTFVTELPSYYKEVQLGLKILVDGVVSSIPFMTSTVYNFIVAWFADWLIRRRICSVGEVRKLATVGGLVIPAFLLIASSYVGKEDKVLPIVLISLSLTFQVMLNVGSSLNQLDISPRFAGILLGIGNAFATLSGIASPLVTGWLTNNEPTRGQWQKVFYISAIISIVGAVIFVVFGSGEVQSWNTSNDDLLEEVEVERENRKPRRQYQSINT